MNKVRGPKFEFDEGRVGDHVAVRCSRQPAGSFRNGVVLRSFANHGA